MNSRRRRQLRRLWVMVKTLFTADIIYECPWCREWYTLAAASKWRDVRAIVDPVTRKRRAVCPSCRPR